MADSWRGRAKTQAVPTAEEGSGGEEAKKRSLLNLPKSLQSSISMSAKRSRSGGSSSFDDAGVSNHHLLPPKQPAEGSDPRRHVRAGFGNGAKALKPSPEAEKSPPSVLRMSSPETARMGRAAQVDEFLEQCFFCHRKLPHNEDVFMYGPFRAFCSPECRDQQFNMENVKDQPKQARLQSTKTLYSMTNNVNGRRN
ncbi:hypothetical protein ACFX2J_030859 [Malus domestica]